MSFSSFYPKIGTRIAVGISGGVDSSVTAYLLKQAGYDVIGIFMKNWEETFSVGYCTAEDDLEDARDVCEWLDIPLHTVNFVREYQDRVFRFFLAEYQSGRTPNPDVLCNREIKFSELLQYAQKLGADYLATGHYAKRVQTDDSALLCTAMDTDKDQTYFLHQLHKPQLEKALFPLGEMKKKDVRALAQKVGLNTFDKKDSTGICFIGERPFREFLQKYFPTQPGVIQTPEGEALGEHLGLMYYTIGQRQGLGIGGVADAKQAPWYVLDKDLARNVLIVGQGDHPLLYHRQLYAQQLSWINCPPTEGRFYQAKIRYRQAYQSCTLRYVDDGVLISFTEPQRAITPGQYVVLYDGEICLGGGVITRRITQIDSSTE